MDFLEISVTYSRIDGINLVTNFDAGIFLTFAFILLSVEFWCVLVWIKSKTEIIILLIKLN